MRQWFLNVGVLSRVGTRWLTSIALIAMATLVLAQPPENVQLGSAFSARVLERGSLKITLGEIRMVMRGPMFPGLARVGEKSLLITAARAEEGGSVVSIRSDNLGETWRPYEPGIPRGAGMNTVRLRNGRVFSLMYDTKPIADKPGFRSTTRWESDDEWKTLRGPFTDGDVHLPPDKFNTANIQWFHGNTIEMPDGALLAAMQGIDKEGSGIYPFHTFVSRSEDGGKTWTFLARVASLGNLDDPDGRTKKGWRLHGPCEHSLVHLGDGNLISVARLVNDDRDPVLGKGSDTYRDLSYAVPGSGIHPGTVLPAKEFFAPGPRSAPLVISYSSDAGRTWTRPKPMAEACGCFPRMALSEGVVALSYGGLAYPRWGNSIQFSTDGGKTWTGEINYAPLLTTGYTDIVAIGPRKFLCVFDCTPPQPWTDHAAHWVGVLDIQVETVAGNR
ncbi:MAG: sialidase family protein [Planctomycetia bacterium]|nr:sialidase family protein [Planctomycetia bacterium]